MTGGPPPTLNDNPVASRAGDGTSKAPGRLLPGARAPDPEQCAGKAHAHAHAQAHPHARAPTAQLAALQVRSPTASPSSWLLREHTTSDMRLLAQAAHALHWCIACMTSDMVWC